jgi:hypothetical protein
MGIERDAIMETIPDHDKYYDPPEGPTHSPCDGCGEVFDNGDLNQIGWAGHYRWLCDKCMDEGEYVVPD